MLRSLVPIFVAAAVAGLGVPEAFAPRDSRGSVTGMATIEPVEFDKYSRKFAEWARRDKRGRARLDLAEVTEEVESSFAVRNSSRDDLDLALLELAASCRADRGDQVSDAVSDIVLRALEQRLTGRSGSGFEDYLLERVLPVQAELSAQVRASACDVLGTQMRAALVAPLVNASVDDEVVLRLAALGALAGFADARASRALLEACERAGGDEGVAARTLLVHHLEALELAQKFGQAWPLDLTERLPRAALPALVDGDWRSASRGVRLARWCTFETSAPRYIEALHTWRRREAASSEPSGLTGMRRVQFEIADLLHQGSGLDLGLDPERWKQWWRTRTNGGEPPKVSTRSVAPGFFGLRVRSGAVAFVIDASGSMDYPVPSRDTRGSTATRFEEATEQLDLVLRELSPPSSFQVVLFNDVGVRWSDGAQAVTESTRASVKSWLRRNGPKGGTRLSVGLDALLPRDASGAFVPGALDVDTVVVLCDGETVEDGRWARSWLANYNESAQLVFHCVQIGGSRAEALEALSNGTGGRFVRVGK